MGSKSRTKNKHKPIDFYALVCYNEKIERRRLRSHNFEGGDIMARRKIGRLDLLVEQKQRGVIPNIVGARTEHSCWTTLNSDDILFELEVPVEALALRIDYPLSCRNKADFAG